MITSSLNRFLKPVSQPAFASAALLLLRLIIGAAFIFHGWGKIQSPWSWMPAQAPISIPPLFQFLAALSEFGGGIALTLGFLTRIASLGLSCTMAVAVYFHAIVNKDPFVSSAVGPTYEPALVYLCVFILILALGPGKFSLDAKTFGERCS